MSQKIATPFPIFSPPTLPPSSRRGGAATELRFSRWNNANAEPFLRRRREQQQIELDLRLHRRHTSASNIADDDSPYPYDASAAASAAADFKSLGTPSSPSPPSIPGKSSKYSKPPTTTPHPAFRRRLRASLAPPPHDSGDSISFGDHGISYRVKDAPFEFQYSYTETPKVKPLALREPAFLPFGPVTMPRPWTGRAPLPGTKKKLPEFDSFRLPPPGKKGVKPVQAPGPFLAGSGPKYVASREEILGEPLNEEEVRELVKGSLKTRRVLTMGRDGLTHNMLENIHAHWKRKRICKIKCLGVCTVDMDNIKQQLEEKTGGKIIYNRGGVIFLFRGRNYNYRTRPRYPLMLWKPITPVYPRLVQKIVEGLTLEETIELRKKGHKLPPICKLGKNGLYADLAQHVREAFEECEMVRINCKDMNSSDLRKIGAKLKDLVPCVLLSFAFEHILLWRGKDWKSSLIVPEGDHDGSVELVTVSNKLNLERPIDKTTSIIGETEASFSSEASDQLLSTCNEANSSNIVGEDSSLVVEEEPPALENADHCLLEREPQLLPSSSGDHTSISDSDNAIDNPEIVSNDSPRSESDTRSSSCLDGVMLLLSQAIESGSAVILDAESLDGNIIYERSVALASTAAPGPVFEYKIRKSAVQKTEIKEAQNYEVQDVEAEVVDVQKVEKRGNERKSSKTRRREDLRDIVSDLVPLGSLGVDELAKLLR